MAFLDWFKSKSSKSPDSNPEAHKPAQASLSVTPKAAMQQAPQANAGASKAVLPKSIQPLNLSSRRTTAPLGLKSTGPIRMDDPSVPAIKPSSAAPLNPESAVPQKHIELELGDFLGKVPGEMLAAGEINPSEKITIPSKQFASDLSRGKASVPLATLQNLRPDLFTPDAASSDLSIPLPLSKIVSQIGDFKLRDDQRTEEGPEQNFETPFLKGAIRDGANIEPAQARSEAPVPSQPRTEAPPLPASPPKPNPLKATPPVVPTAGAPREAAQPASAPPVQPPPLSTASSGIKMPPIAPPPIKPAFAQPAPVAKTPATPAPALRPSPAPAPLPAIPAAQAEGDVQIRHRPPATVRATVAGGKIRISGKPGTSPLAVTPPAAKTLPSGLPKPATPAFLSPLTSTPASPALPVQPPAPEEELEPASELPPESPAPVTLAPTVPESGPAPESTPAPEPDAVEDSAPPESTPSLSIPLTMIIDSIPGAIVEGDLEGIAQDTEVAVPLSVITPQLSRGSVKISIQTLTGLLPAELKRLFSDPSSTEEIPLPLQYVLSHLPASAFAQRTDQIDDRPDVEIPTPFSQKAKEDAERLEEPETTVAESDPLPEEPVASATEELPLEDVTPEEEQTGPEISAGADSPAGADTPEEEEPPVQEADPTPPSLPSLPPSIFASSSPDVRGRHVKPFISRRALRTIDAAEDSLPKPPLSIPPAPPAAVAPPADIPAAEVPPAPVEKPESPAPEVAARPSASEGMAQLQEIFMTDETLDARAVARLCCSLPGVAAAVFSTRDGLHLAGGIEGLGSVSALCALVPQAYEKMEKFSKDATLGHATSLTISTNGELFSIFGELDVFVVIKHDGRELKPGIRAKLQGVANGLSCVYAPSTGTGN